MSDLKSNINKIHSNLQDKFQNINIKELSNRRWGNYFEIEINEGFTVKMSIPSKDINNNGFKWFYSANPDNPKSELVERTSKIDRIDRDIKDIIDNQRFDGSYLNKINK